MKKLPLLITFILLFGCVPPVSRAGTSNVTVNNLTGSLNMGQMGAGVELGFSVPTGYTLRFKSGSTLVIDAGATLTGFPAAIINSGLTGNGFVYANGSNSIISTAAATNGQLLIGRTGLPPLAASLSGTANEITATGGAGTLTLSLPSALTFTGKTITGGTFSAPSYSTTTSTLATFNDTFVNGAYINFTHSAVQYGALGGAKQVFGGSELTTDLGIAAGSFADRIRIGSTPGGTPAVSIDQNGLNAAIGQTTTAAAAFTTVAASGNITHNTGTVVNVLGSGGGDGIVGTVSNHDLVLFQNNTIRARLSSNGFNSTTIGASSPAPGTFTTAVADTLIISTHTPSSASDTGTAGTITWDASFIYVCVATNTWKRVAIATW